MEEVAGQGFGVGGAGPRLGWRRDSIPGPTMESVSLKSKGRSGSGTSSRNAGNRVSVRCVRS